MYNYSVDKIKLEFQYIKTDRINDFLKSLELCLNAEFRYYLSDKMVKCKHNFLFSSDDVSFYLGVVPNWKSECKSDKSVILEYNPNKVNPFLLDELKWLLNIPKACIKVMCFDIAVDMPIPYCDIRMLKRDKREYMATMGHSDVETRYLGALGHNHIKLYDKALEQKVDIDWTRFEITIKEINSLSSTLKEFENTIKLPQLYRIKNQIDFSLMQYNDTTRLALESIIRDIDLLYSIKRYDTRKRYEQLLHDVLDNITIDVKEMYKAYSTYCDSFSNLDNIDLIDINSILLK